MVAVCVYLLLAVGGIVQAAHATTAPGPSSETATQFYMRYRAAVNDARSVDEILAFWTAETAGEYKSAPADQRVDLAGIKRIYSMVSNVKVTREALSVDAGTSDATLSLEGVGVDQKKVTGTAHLVKKAGQWRLAGQEAWQSPQR